ncbi:MAG: hypothetical protein K8R23_05305 [Chthoniobacter sp.]|nr:hypothetical protein [Chthoniobacter sp.]
MKRLTALLAATLLTTPALFAEENKVPALRATPAETRDNVPPEGDRLELMPTKPAQLLPPPAGLPLIPEIPQSGQLPPIPRHNSFESPIKRRDSATADAEDAVKQRIRIREAKTKAQRDPAVQAEWDRASTLKTDYEKRDALKSYYRLLYGRMIKIDPSLKVPADALLQQSLARLEQTKIAPTQPPTAVASGPRAAR